MYRQPENNNRVKNMKSHFEKLDYDNKQHRKIDNQTTKSDDEYENLCEKSSKHSSLQRQLSDPSKRSCCVKRTPAFRKEKFPTGRSRTSTELTFAGKVSLFEDNTDCCDTSQVPEREKKKLSTSASLVVNKPHNTTVKRCSLSPRRYNIDRHNNNSSIKQTNLDVSESSLYAINKTSKKERIARDMKKNKFPTDNTETLPDTSSKCLDKFTDSLRETSNNKHNCYDKKGQDLSVDSFSNSSFLYCYLENVENVTKLTDIRNSRNSLKIDTVQNWKINDDLSTDPGRCKNDTVTNESSITSDFSSEVLKELSGENINYDLVNSLGRNLSNDPKKPLRCKSSNKLVENLKQLADQYKDQNLWESSDPNLWSEYQERISPEPLNNSNLSNYERDSDLYERREKDKSDLPEKVKTAVNEHRKIQIQIPCKSSNLSPEIFKKNSNRSTEELMKSNPHKVKKLHNQLETQDVKIRSKSNQNRSEFANTRKTTVSFIKEMIENKANNEFESKLHEENLEVKRIPEYAQVNKSKKRNAQLRNRQSESLTDTLKAALKRPLPTGPPPKKPPRTFTHNVNSSGQTSNASATETNIKTSDKAAESVFKDKLNSVLSQDKPTKVKSDPKAMLQKLENALLNNKIRSPKLPKKIKSSLDGKNLFTSTASNDYTTEPNLKSLFPNCLSGLNCANVQESYSQSATLLANTRTFVDQEHIYAEPFEYQVLDGSSDNTDEAGTSTISRSVHYLSCPVPVTSDLAGQTLLNVTDSNEQSSIEQDKDKGLNKQKLKLIMNDNYASLHTQSDLDDIDSSASTSPTLENTSTKKDIRQLIKLYEDKKKNLQPQVPHEAQDQSGNLPNKRSISMIEEKNKIKVDLKRSLTEIRKNYVKRVCSTVRRKCETKVTESSHLFECCLLVELNVSTLQPYVKGKYPFKFEVPPWVEHLCYPDLTEWSPETLSKNASTDPLCQCFSLVITNERGDRKFGYCRRVLPEGASFCLPLTYCIISTHRAPGFYYKILKELESRHGLPSWLQNTFLHQLYYSNFPRPGQNVQIPCLLQTLVTNKSIPCEQRDLFTNTTDDNKDWLLCNISEAAEYNNQVEKNIFNVISKMDLNADNAVKIDKLIKQFESISVQNVTRDSFGKNNVNVSDLLNLMVNSDSNQDCLLVDVVFRRPYDHRIEETDLTVLFNTLKLDVLLQIFASLLLERKVILIGKCLSQLSLCVEAMQSILYPFSWQHTFIPVLSSTMLDVLSAPLPLVTGVLKSHVAGRDEICVEDGIVVDLDKSIILCSVGDENRILPKKLRNGLLHTLHLLTTSHSVDDSKNVLVSEAFLRMFVEVCGHCNNYIVTNDSQEKMFDKDGFIKHLESKSMQLFLEWFTETAMFQMFIQQQIEGVGSEDVLFEQRCLELRKESNFAKNTAIQKVKNLFR